MFFRLFLLFITVPLLELLVFLTLGSRIGIAATVLIVVLTGFLGAWLTRRQGLKVLARYREATAAGRMPHGEVIDGIMVLLAGAVLLTPGFLTDALGFALLVPAVRSLVRAALAKQLEKRVEVMTGTAGTRPGDKPAGGGGTGRVINVETEVVEEKPGRE